MSTNGSNSVPPPTYTPPSPPRQYIPPPPPPRQYIPPPPPPPRPYIPQRDETNDDLGSAPRARPPPRRSQRSRNQRRKPRKKFPEDPLLPDDPLAAPPNPGSRRETRYRPPPRPPSYPSPYPPDSTHPPPVVYQDIFPPYRPPPSPYTPVTPLQPAPSPYTPVAAHQPAPSPYTPVSAQQSTPSPYTPVTAHQPAPSPYYASSPYNPPPGTYKTPPSSYYPPPPPRPTFSGPPPDPYGPPVSYPPDPLYSFRTVEHRFAGWLFRIRTNANAFSKRLDVKRVGDVVEYRCSGVLLTKLKYRLERDIFSLHEDPNKSQLQDKELCSKIEILMAGIVAEVFEHPWRINDLKITWGVSECGSIGNGESLHVQVSRDTSAGDIFETSSIRSSGTDATPFPPYRPRLGSSDPYVSGINAFHRISSLDKLEDGKSRSPVAQHAFERSQIIAVLRRVELITAMQLGQRSYLLGGEVASEIGSKDFFFPPAEYSGRFDATVPTLFGLLVSKLRYGDGSSTTYDYTHTDRPWDKYSESDSALLPAEDKPMDSSAATSPPPPIVNETMSTVSLPSYSGANVSDLESQSADNQSQDSGDDPFALALIVPESSNTEKDASSDEKVSPHLQPVDDPSEDSPDLSKEVVAPPPPPQIDLIHSSDGSFEKDNEKVRNSIASPPSSPPSPEQFGSPFAVITLPAPPTQAYEGPTSTGLDDDVPSPAHGQLANSSVSQLGIPPLPEDGQMSIIESTPDDLTPSANQENSAERAASAGAEQDPVGRDELELPRKRKGDEPNDSSDVSSGEGQTQAPRPWYDVDTTSTEQDESVESGASGAEEQDLDERDEVELSRKRREDEQGDSDDVSSAEGEIEPVRPLYVVDTTSSDEGENSALQPLGRLNSGDLTSSTEQEGETESLRDWYDVDTTSGEEDENPGLRRLNSGDLTPSTKQDESVELEDSAGAEQDLDGRDELELPRKRKEDEQDDSEDVSHAEGEIELVRPWYGAHTTSSDEGDNSALRPLGRLNSGPTPSTEQDESVDSADERQQIDGSYALVQPDEGNAKKHGRNDPSSRKNQSQSQGSGDKMKPISILRHKSSRRKGKVRNQVQFSLPSPDPPPPDEAETRKALEEERLRQERDEASRFREMNKLPFEAKFTPPYATPYAYPTPYANSSYAAQSTASPYATVYTSPYSAPYTSPVAGPYTPPSSILRTPSPLPGVDNVPPSMNSAYPSDDPEYKVAVDAGQVYDRPYQGISHEKPPSRRNSTKSDAGHNHDANLCIPYSSSFPTPPERLDLLNEGTSLPMPATSRKQSHSYSRLSRRSSGLTRKNSNKSWRSEDSYLDSMGSKRGHVPGKNRASLHVAKDLFTVVLGSVIVILSILAIALDPAEEENWFKRIEQGIFVMFSLGVPTLLAMRSRLSDNLDILLPKTTRDVRSLQDLQNMNKGMKYDDFVKQLQKAILFDEKLSDLFSFKNAGYKASRKSGKLVMPVQAKYTKAFKMVWFFGEELAFNKLLGKAFRYRHENNVLYIEKDCVDIEGVIVHVRRRSGKYILGSAPEN